MRMIVDARQQYVPESAALATQMNHDLRSPLTAICSYAECLTLVTDMEAACRERYARAIIAEARRLARMSANFLLLAAPQSDTPPQQAEVRETLTEVLSELSDVLAAQNTTVELSCPDEPMLLAWNRSVLRHLLTATLECVLESAERDAVVSVQVEIRPDGMALLLSISAAQALDTCSFAFQAATRLISTRGGRLLLPDGDRMQLRLLIPYSGALCAAPGMSLPSLRRTA